MLNRAPDGKLIPSVAYERKLMQGVTRFLHIQNLIRVEPPVFVMLRLLNVAGYTMGFNEMLVGEQTFPIEKDSIVLPESVIDSYDVDVAEVLKPTFDAIANAAGLSGSPNYNDRGKWVGPR